MKILSLILVLGCIHAVLALEYDSTLHIFKPTPSDTIEQKKSFLDSAIGTAILLEGIPTPDWFYRLSIFEPIIKLGKLPFCISSTLLSISAINAGKEYHISMNPIFMVAASTFLVGSSYARPSLAEGLTPSTCISFLILSFHLIPNASLLFPIIDEHLFLRVGQNMDYYLFSKPNKIYYENNIALQAILSPISIYVKASKPWFPAYNPSKDIFLYFGVGFVPSFKVK